MKKQIAHTFFLCMLSFGIPFNTIIAQSNSTVLRYKEYITSIYQYHPIAKKAALKITGAKAKLLEAKGNLDPIFFSDWNQKSFDDKLYYRQYQAKLKLPTRLGIDVVGGYENTEGIFLNPENKTDAFGLWHIGLEVNILQGLLVNERKTALEQANVFQALAQNEQQIILNDLIYNASAAYLIWQQYASFKEILTENVSLAATYFENTKQTFFNGEKTAMDTLEAFISYQDAIVFQQNNELSWIKSRQIVENYLWYKDQPVSLQISTQPEKYQTQLLPEFEAFKLSDLSNHPLLLASVNKLSYLEIAQKMKREKQKPKLKIKYNPLLKTASDKLTPNPSFTDYKWGFDFSMPLLLRSERAAVQQGEIKIQETQLDLQHKRNELQNKIEGSWAQQVLLQEQLALLSDNVDRYKRLLDGENEKFKYGESAVFLLNKRQEKYINGQLKLVKTAIKQQLELLNFLYFSNQLIPQ